MSVPERLQLTADLENLIAIVADVLREHQATQPLSEFRCSCGTIRWTSHTRHQAAMVVARLGVESVGVESLLTVQRVYRLLALESQ